MLREKGLVCTPTAPLVISTPQMDTSFACRISFQRTLSCGTKPLQFKVTPILKLQIEEPIITGTVQLYASPKPNQHRSLKLIHKLPSPQSPSTAIHIVHTLHDGPKHSTSKQRATTRYKMEGNSKKKKGEEVEMDPNLTQTTKRDKTVFLNLDVQ